MNWETAEKFDWSGPISNRPAKEELGRQIAAKVEDGDVIGAGSGSTSYLAIRAIGERIKREKLHISVICTSHEATMACTAAGIPVTTLLRSCPDWCFDGADEVDPNRSLIKGRGGAMFLEKLVMRSAPQSFILVDSSKLVDKLGEKFAVPVEFLPESLHIVERELIALGATELSLRLAVGKDGPIVTQSGNFIFDARFKEIGKSMERDIKSITGVMESGLFIGHPVEVLVAG
ncbi:MAG TPA: ribose 5-phosphate isomerase A [Bryobacteraceae bacterium]|nr:ribose 5-phosphate isomerase A [Bryobacteraceae bacterium]